MPGLRHRHGRGAAPANLHQPQHPHHLPAQRHLGHRKPVPQQGPAAAHGDGARGVFAGWGVRLPDCRVLVQANHTSDHPIALRSQVLLCA